MCVPGCIDLYAPASCLSGGRQNTVWLLSASVAMVTQHQQNLEDGNKPHIEDKSSFWQTKRNLCSLPPLGSLCRQRSWSVQLKQAPAVWTGR